MSRPTSKVTKVRVTGPLAPFAAGFRGRPYVSRMAGVGDARHRPVDSAQMLFMAIVPDMHGPEGATSSG